MLDGAVQLSVTTPEAATALSVCGTVGTVAGIAGALVPAGEAPRLLVAITLKVYAVPFVRPVTTHEVAGAVAVQVAPPGVAVTV